METVKSIRDKIVQLYDAGDHLPAFVLQAMYIESVTRAYAEAMLKTSIGGRNISKVLLENILEEFGDRKKKTADLLVFLADVKWLEHEEKLALQKYFNFRNAVIHALVKEIKNSSFLEKIREHYEIGQRILSSSIFLRLDPMLTALDEKRFIYGHGKIYGGGKLSDGVIYDILALSLEGKSEEEIVKKLNVERRLIKQVIQNKLATTIQINVSLKGRKRRTKEENRDQIVSEISRELGVKDSEILGNSRVVNIVFARHICMYLLKRVVKYSYPVTARLLRRADHTTVISAVRRIEKLVDENRIRIRLDV